MQLPRGTFRYIKKDTQLGGILEDLQLMKFSGICTISFGSANGSLVFKSGKRILAEFRNVEGDGAWNEFQKIYNEKVDASVSAMDDTQIELSLEFNKSCRIGKGKMELSLSFPPKIEPFHQVKKTPPTQIVEPLVAPVKGVHNRHIPEISAAHPAVPLETLNVPEQARTLHNKTPPPGSPVHAPVVQQKPPENSQNSGEGEKSDDETGSTADGDSRSFENDIDALETMDVDVMTSKIRGECKTLIKQLRLEHLTDH